VESVRRLILHSGTNQLKVDIQQSDMRHLSPPRRAIEWLRANENPRGGMYADSSHAYVYPEVTGYLVPTLLEYGESELTIRLARWLLRVQRRDGSYASAIGESNVFDTAQVLRGLLAVGDLLPGASDACRSAADYLYSRMVDGGIRGLAVDSAWIRRYSKAIPMSAHLYALPPLHQASKVLRKPEYRIAADRCMEYYLRRQDALQISTLTHFFAYELEALIDLGRREAAIPALNVLRRLQGQDGSVRGIGGVTWVCAPGLAQLAVCWYKVGDRTPADRAMEWLEEHQMPSGGFLGSYGSQATYFPDVEIPWAAKFYLDANLLREERVPQS
jgi:malonyl-CoA O-methyltransferase